MTPYTPNEAGTHLASLQLLEEAADYLRRLPANPMTNQMLLKIKQHLAEPGAGVQKKRLEVIAKDEEWKARISSGAALKGTSGYAPSGAPIIMAMITGNTLRLQSPLVAKTVEVEGLASAKINAHAIGEKIAAGVEIKLTQITRYEQLHMLHPVSTKLDGE